MGASLPARDAGHSGGFSRTLIMALGGCGAGGTHEHSQSLLVTKITWSLAKSS